MILHPSLHIAYFGVFPDKYVSDEIREGLLAERASAHEKDIAQQGAMREDEVNRLIEGKGNISDLDALDNFDEAFEEQRSVAKMAALRMRNAYQFAAKQGWVKPIRGEVYLAPSVRVGDEIREDLEQSIFSTFYQAVRQEYLPSLTLQAPAQDREPFALLAHMRCLVSGELAPFMTFNDHKYLFKSARPQYQETNLDESLFDFTGIDTVAHCKAGPMTVNNLQLLGHGGIKPPKPPGRAPV